MTNSNGPNSGTSQWNRWFMCLLLFGSSPLTLADPEYPTQVVNSGSHLDLGLSAEASESIAISSRPDLSGTWVLDPEASDDLKEVLKDARSGRARPSSGGRGDGGFGRRPGGMGMPDGGRESRRKSGEGHFRRSGRPGSVAMDELSAKTLDIDHREPLLTVTTQRQGTRKLYTDFRGASVSAKGGMDQEVVTGGWEQDALVIEITSPGGNHMVLRLRLLDEPLRLERVTELKDRDENGKAIQLKQIFLPKDSLNADNLPKQNSNSSDISWLEE